MTASRTLRRIAALPFAVALASLAGTRHLPLDAAEVGAPDTLVVFNAGSLARPLRAALDSFNARARVVVQQESAGSLETARKLTELHKIPDVIALADHEVFPQLLMPSQTTWYVQFARNRMGLAYTANSRYADQIDSRNWYRLLARRGVEVGRADPSLDPNGYRTLLTLQLAERYYKVPGLYESMLRASPARNVRPKEVDLVALLQSGELDYIWSYESVATSARLNFLRLPEQIDLGTAAESAFYAQASVRVPGRTPADTVEFRGQPIVYGLSIPREAPHPAVAARFVSFLLSADGRRIARREKLDMLDAPVVIGRGAPAGIAPAGAR